MPTIVSLSRAVLSLAAWVAPSSRQTMCQAMRAELDVLDEGWLSWALGGLASAVGWRMRVDGLFWALVLIAGIAWDYVTNYLDTPLFKLVTFGWPPLIYGYWLLKTALLCALLAAWRPRLGPAAAVAYFIAQQITGQVVWIYILRWPTKGVKIMDASPVVGLSAILAWCLIGAWAGATLRRALTKPSPAGPA